MLPHGEHVHFSSDPGEVGFTISPSCTLEVKLLPTKAEEKTLMNKSIIILVLVSMATTLFWVERAWR